MVILNQITPVKPEMSPLDSLLDLLNRDQRTIVTINRTSRCDDGSSRPGDFDLRIDRNSKKLENSSSYGFNKKVTTRNRGSRKKFHSLPRLMCRLGEVFIVGVCLLTVVRVPAVMSAPSTRHGETTDQIHFHKPTEDIVSYMYPCGKAREEEMNKTYYKMASRSRNPDIFRNIIIGTKNALGYAENFREGYVEETFHTSFEKHHSQWRNHKYDFLPNHKRIPKNLGEDVSVVHLQSRSIDEFLIEIYEDLQKIAVGLEQVVADQKKLHGEFSENFERLEGYLRHVLCLIREAMVERDIFPRGQVPRSIMESKYRDMEHPSSRNLRDWLIFRDLMNGLEYVIQVFSFIEGNLPRSSSPLLS